jgi:ABC-type sugar transport system ATPase subunit
VDWRAAACRIQSEIRNPQFPVGDPQSAIKRPRGSVVSQVELRQVSKVYPGGVQALIGVDLKVEEGELLTVVGPSGSGKSTVLRLIAGLEPLSDGGIWIGGRRADQVAPYDRDVAMVFQHPAAYPHLSVYENLAFGLRARHVANAEIDNRVREAANLLGLSELLSRRPRALSGGERQRVAIGRALARRPGLLLLDEPLSSLDAPMRSATRADLIDLHRRLRMTMILVTHDQAEALAVGDRIAVLDRGRLIQVGTAGELYSEPATKFVAQFIGSPPMTVLPCKVGFDEGCVRVQVEGVGAEPVDVPRGTAWISPVERSGARSVAVGVRAEPVGMTSGGDEAGSVRMIARVRRVEPTGADFVATVVAGEATFTLRVTEGDGYRVGNDVAVRLPLRRGVWFHAESGERMV